MSPNRFDVLSDFEEDIADIRPSTTQGDKPFTPQKRPKRKAISPISKTSIPPKSVSYFLVQAKKAISAAIKAEKDGQGEEYLEDNNIYLLSKDLDYILESRKIDITNNLESIKEKTQIQDKII